MTVPNGARPFPAEWQTSYPLSQELIHRVPLSVCPAGDASRYSKAIQRSIDSSNTASFVRTRETPAHHAPDCKLQSGFARLHLDMRVPGEASRVIEV